MPVVGDQREGCRSHPRPWRCTGLSSLAWEPFTVQQKYSLTFSEHFHQPTAPARHRAETVRSGPSQMLFSDMLTWLGGFIRYNVGGILAELPHPEFVGEVLHNIFVSLRSKTGPIPVLSLYPCFPRRIYQRVGIVPDRFQ
jgi:hypothetical protein